MPSGRSAAPGSRSPTSPLFSVSIGARPVLTPAGPCRPSPDKADPRGETLVSAAYACGSRTPSPNNCCACFCCDGPVASPVCCSAGAEVSAVWTSTLLSPLAFFASGTNLSESGIGRAGGFDCERALRSSLMGRKAEADSHIIITLAQLIKPAASPLRAAVHRVVYSGRFPKKQCRSRTLRTSRTSPTCACDVAHATGCWRTGSGVEPGKGLVQTFRCYISLS